MEWKKGLEEVRHFIERTYGGIDKIPAELEEELLKLEQQVDVSINNLEEDYHSDVEGDGTRWLGLLQKKDISFYVNVPETDKGYYDDERLDFLYFLCVQYFRTKAMRERWIFNFEPCFHDPRWSRLNIPKEKIHMENLAHHFFWEIQSRVVYVLRKQNANIALLINHDEQKVDRYNLCNH